MKMITVQSSQIAEVGYDGANALRIQFRRGELYEYDNVTPALFEEFMGCDSIGRFFTARIKGNNAHPFRKISGEVAQERTVVLEAPQEIVSAIQLGRTSGDVQRVEQESSDLADQAKAMRVTDTRTQELASDMLRTVATMRGKVASTWKPMKEAAHRAHRVICEQEKAVDAPLLEAETALKREIGAYVSAERERAFKEEQRLRREEQERAEREAKAESERLALEDALRLEAEGEHAAADAAIAAPLPVAPRYVPPPPVAPQVARVAGVSTREVYRFRVVNEAAVPRQYLCLDEKRIGQVVRAMGPKANIPGVEVYAETTVAARRA